MKISNIIILEQECSQIEDEIFEVASNAHHQNSSLNNEEKKEIERLNVEFKKRKALIVRIKSEYQTYLNNVLVCSGEVGVGRLNHITEDNVLSQRNWFLENVSNNGIDSHQAIIDVLIYMSFYIKK